jgi:integrase/recombinase XerD
MARKRQRGNGSGTLFQRDGGGCWIAKWYDHNGQRQERSTKTTDKRAADRILSTWTTAATLRREGSIDARAEALAQQARRPIGEHLADWEAALMSKGSSARHVELVTSRTRKVMEAAGFKRWSDMSASRAMEYLKELRADREIRDEAGNVVKTQRGISSQTFNFYQQAVKQFGRWMVKDRRATDNPFAYLEPLNVRTDRRRDRRALTPDELRTLIITTEGSPARFGMTGLERALMYRLAAETGLRAAELRSLTRASFHLDGGEPTVTVAAAYSKRRREDTCPMRPGLAESLRTHLANKAPAALAFNAPTTSWDFADVFKADRKAAGIDYRDDAGRVADFHALRHTFISNLAAGKVAPKTAQALARHSTITLTMDRYTHQYAGDERQALDVLPDLSIPEVAEATGTDGKPVNTTDVSITPTSRPTSSSATSRIPSAAQRVEQSTPAARMSVPRNVENTNDNAGFCDPTRSVATRCNDTRPIGLEPMTPGLGNRCSIQLSYGRLRGRLDRWSVYRVALRVQSQELFRRGLTMFPLAMPGHPRPPGERGVPSDVTAETPLRDSGSWPVAGCSSGL